jgi:IclR helix-turn-helix domain
VIRAVEEQGSTSVAAALAELRQSIFRAYTPEWLSERASQVGGKSISSQLLQGLVLLSCFPTDGSYVSNEEVARMLDIGSTRAHRIISTFVAVGFLERDPVSRRYRRGLA